MGANWAANDPAILLTYANDPFPLTGMKMPTFVVRIVPFEGFDEAGTVFDQRLMRALMLGLPRLAEGKWLDSSPSSSASLSTGPIRLASSRKSSADGLTGLSVDRGDQGTEGRPNPLQALLDQTLEAYDPYMEDKRIFDTSKSGPIIERRGLRFPRFDYSMFERGMSYAIGAAWGAKLIK